MIGLHIIMPQPYGKGRAYSKFMIYAVWSIYLSHFSSTKMVHFGAVITIEH